MYDVNGMGNMSTLEQKVDVLLRFCMAQTEEERQKCRGDVDQLCGPEKQKLLSEELQARADRILRELGIPEILNGFSYILSAVKLLAENPELRHGVTTVIYPYIARLYNVGEFTVERGIRYAIEVGWMRCDGQTQQKFFGNQIDPDKGKPTNSQFLIRVANMANHDISCLQN